MKVQPMWLLIILSLAQITLAGCRSPQPLPVAPTPIPTLIPATLPARPTATLRPAALGVTFPSRRPSAQAASVLYQQDCANCHGAAGKGTVPGARDLSDADYLRGETPVRFYQIISDGRGSMPGWQNRLPADERWDLTFYIWHFAVSPEMLEQGQTVYRQNCASCHGPDGKGLVPGTVDFTNVEWMAGQAARDFFQVVTEGRGTMPSWQARLSPADRWASIEYLRTFAYEPFTSPDTATPTGVPPALRPTEEPRATPASAPPTGVPPTPGPTEEPEATPASAAGKSGGDASAIFATQCAGCHGSDGKGGYGPALTSLDDRSDAELTEIIVQGVGEMPGLGEKLGESAVEALVSFVRSLSEGR